MPQFNALRALHLLQEYKLEIPFLVVTGSISEEVAVECMRQGAADYVLKDHLQRLGQAVINVLEQKGLRAAKRQAEEKYRSIFENAVDSGYILTDKLPILS
jgi:DNA-binding NtrC family response regulator